jgi:hypothetical protein
MTIAARSGVIPEHWPMPPRSGPTTYSPVSGQLFAPSAYAEPDSRAAPPSLENERHASRARTEQEPTRIGVPGLVSGSWAGRNSKRAHYAAIPPSDSRAAPPRLGDGHPDRRGISPDNESSLPPIRPRATARRNDLGQIRPWHGNDAERDSVTTGPTRLPCEDDRVARDGRRRRRRRRPSRHASDPGDANGGEQD